MTLPSGAGTPQRGRGREGPLATSSPSARQGAWDWPRTFAARGAGALQPRHLHRRTPRPGGGALHCFVLDTSGSMLRDGRLARAKGLVRALLQQAARDHARVALVSFGGARVDVLLAPGRAGAWRDDRIAAVPGGGGTPVADALRRTDTLLAHDARRRPGDTRCVWLLTDGRSTGIPPRPRHAHQVRIIDFDVGPRALGRAAAWVAAWGTDAVHQPAAAWIRPD